MYDQQIPKQLKFWYLSKSYIKHFTYPIKEPENSEIEIVPKDVQPPEGAKVNLGFLHRIFAKCLPTNTAIFMFILVTFCLSASDALSDMALSYFLYSR